MCEEIPARHGQRNQQHGQHRDGRGIFAGAALFQRCVPVKIRVRLEHPRPVHRLLLRQTAHHVQRRQRHHLTRALAVLDALDIHIAPVRHSQVNHLGSGAHAHAGNAEIRMGEPGGRRRACRRDLRRIALLGIFIDGILDLRHNAGIVVAAVAEIKYAGAALGVGEFLRQQRARGGVRRSDGGFALDQLARRKIRKASLAPAVGRGAQRQLELLGHVLRQLGGGGLGIRARRHNDQHLARLPVQIQAGVLHVGQLLCRLLERVHVGFKRAHDQLLFHILLHRLHAVSSLPPRRDLCRRAAFLFFHAGSGGSGMLHAGAIRPAQACLSASDGPAPPPGRPCRPAAAGPAPGGAPSPARAACWTDAPPRACGP